MRTLQQYKRPISTTLFFTALLLLPATAAWANDTPEPKTDTRPNIVFLLIDDMGWPDIACFGNRFNESPRIDQLCSEGMKFTDFYAATPVCSSTRGTIQSGQYSARTGITNFVPGHWRPFEQLIEPEINHNLGANPDVQTPGELLADAGYATGYFGKWHLEYANDTTRLYPDENQRPENRGYQTTERTIPREFHEQRGTKPVGPKKIDLLTDMSLWFIEQNKDRPFFLTLSHYAVHIPVETISTSHEKYASKPTPPPSDEYPGINNPYYAGMIEDMDRQIGRILDRLDELGLSDNTIVVFTSDNGGLQVVYTALFRDDNEISSQNEIISSNSPLRDEKGSLYEGGIRVPMIVRWPGVVKPGSVCRKPTATTDLLPTFCDMADAPLPEQKIDGVSLVPLLESPDAIIPRDAIYFHYPHYHHSRPSGAIRYGDMKLIENFDDGSLELYNLRTDIGERTNLAPKMPTCTAVLHKKLTDWQKSIGAKMPTENPDFDPARREEWWSRRSKQPAKHGSHYNSRVME